MRKTNAGSRPAPSKRPQARECVHFQYDMPSNRHDQGGDLSFADGHAESWHWKSPMTTASLPSALSYPVTTGQMPDFKRIGNAMLIPH